MDLFLIWSILCFVICIAILAVREKFGLQNDAGMSSAVRQWIQTKYLGDKYYLNDMFAHNQELVESGEKPLFETIYKVDQYESQDQLSSKEFFNKYLRKSKPVYIKGLARQWPAFENWRNDSYLLQ